MAQNAKLSKYLHKTVFKILEARGLITPPFHPKRAPGWELRIANSSKLILPIVHCVQKSIIYKSPRPEKPSMPWKLLHKKIQPPPTVSLYQFGPLRYEQKGKQSQFLGNIDYWVIAEMV